MDLIYSGFEWDKGNSAKNLIKHGITSEEAEQVFDLDPFILEDSKHSTPEEKRFIVLGETITSKPLFIAFTLRNRLIRIISARPMSQKERTWYENQRKKESY
jgi:uncharacterized DUF497 family protein